MICLSSEKLSWGSENQDIAGYFYHILYKFFTKKGQPKPGIFIIKIIIEFFKRKGIKV